MSTSDTPSQIAILLAGLGLGIGLTLLQSNLDSSANMNQAMAEVAAELIAEELPAGSEVEKVAVTRREPEDGSPPETVIFYSVRHADGTTELRHLRVPD